MYFCLSTLSSVSSHLSQKGWYTLWMSVFLVVLVVSVDEPGYYYYHCVVLYVMCKEPAIDLLLWFAVYVWSCPYLTVEVTPAIPVIGAVLFIFVMAALLRTSWSDPGIIPRATAQEAADTERQIGLVFSSFSYLLIQPLPAAQNKDIVIRSFVCLYVYLFIFNFICIYLFIH